MLFLFYLHTKRINRKKARQSFWSKFQMDSTDQTGYFDRTILESRVYKYWQANVAVYND